MDVLVNEILYDPDGADGGYEFVELVAAPGAPADASLAGWVVETGNGSTGEWRVAWTGAAGQRLQGGLFVLGESGVEPRPDVVADLDLQNGPDACRLRSPQGDVDVVGWGTPLPSGFFEAQAAADVAGLALARLPDGADSGQNDVDFRGAPATPGDFNAPESLLLADHVEYPPRGLLPGTPWTFRWRLRNGGRAPWSGDVRIRCGIHPDETLASVHVAPAEAIVPGARAEVTATEFPPRGAHLPRSDPPSTQGGALWRGASEDLAISEVYARPPTGEVEWIEVASVAGERVDLSALRLEDAAGIGGSLASSLAPSAFAVIAADTSRFLARWRVPAGTTLVPLAPWPALNHPGAPTEIAEWVVLAVQAGAGAPDSAEERVAVAALPGGIEEGVSWERISRRLPPDTASSWGPCLDPEGGTPGRPNSRPADVDMSSVTGSLVVRPATFRPARDGAALVVLRPERPAPSCTITIYDSSGLEVAALVPWPEGDGEQRAVWDGRTSSGTPAPLGLYLVCARTPRSAARRVPLVLVR